MKETLEREVKLRPGDGFDFDVVEGERLESRLFESTYFDTRGHRLARHGLTLRYRLENGKGVWQLKLPRSEGRLELEAEGGPSEPPSELAALLRAYVRRDELVAVARLRTRRESVRAGGSEIVHDAVSVLDNQRVTRSFEELEVELIEGDAKALKRLERALRSAGATDAEQRPKLFQALDLDYQPELVDVGKGATPAELLRAALQRQLRELLVHDAGTRSGADVEDLHRFRVATRRLRAYLRAGRGLLDEEWATRMREELGWLGSALGPVRDLDVLIAHLSPGVEDLAEEKPGGNRLLRTLKTERRAARRKLLAALESDRYFALLDALETGPPERLATAASLREIFDAEHRRLRKAIAALGEAPADPALHAARIKVKRARYAAELAGRKKYTSAAKRLQDVLGEHQDASVAAERLRALALRNPELALAAGRLIERQRARAAEARAGWHSAWRSLAKAA